MHEKSVDAALRTPRDLGWGAERKVIACKRCGAHTTLDPHVSASACAFCGTTAVVEAPPNTAIARPEGLLPFRIARETALQSFRKWLHSLWLRPNDLKSASRIDKMQGAYIPFWTFDAATDSWWTAEAGYYYYVPVQVQVNGRTEMRQEQRVRWEPASGFLQLFFDDVPVPASRGVDDTLTRKLEPFPTADLTPYEPSYLSGFLPRKTPSTCPRRWKPPRNACAARSAPPARVSARRHQRNLSVNTQFDALAYKNALLPIWISPTTTTASRTGSSSTADGQCTGRRHGRGSR